MFYKVYTFLLSYLLYHPDAVVFQSFNSMLMLLHGSYIAAINRSN